MAAQEIDADFPQLVTDGYSITSQDTSDYNCFAWASHDTSEWWSPLIGYYWPPANVVPRNNRLETVIKVYAYEGDFVPSDNCDLEAGIEKIALYVNVQGNVTHVARQLPSGLWTSKLGVMEDIQHNRLSSLEDEGISPDHYGKAITFLRRNINRPLPTR
jgi:hypothetical protein